MTETATLIAEARRRLGTGGARAVRRDGRVPAIIYGETPETLAISVSERELVRELHKPGFFRRLYDIEVDGGRHRVLARDVQRHPVTEKPLHVDFLRIGAGARVSVAVAVVFDNEEQSPGLKRGGVLNVVRRDVELVAPAVALPEALHVDLSGLEIGDSVHISQVRLPPDCTPTIADRDFTIATIAAPTVVAEEAAAAEEAAVEEAAVEEAEERAPEAEAPAAEAPEETKED